MSTGTTQLLGADLDDNVSAVTNIGFSFVFQGTPYTQFSLNANGGIRLGATAIASNAYQPWPAPAKPSSPPGAPTRAPREPARCITASTALRRIACW